jgi:hypothetical protein
LRAGESGAGIAPEPIDTRKKKESRAAMDRTLSVTQCPTLSAFFPQNTSVWILLNRVLFAFKRVLNPNSGSATAARRQYQ